MLESNHFERVRDNVFISKCEALTFDHSLLNQLTAIAYKHPRKRARICLHQDLDSDIQEMLITYVNKIYVRPLRQNIDRHIRYSVIDGVADVIEFDDTGNITSSYKVGGPESGYPCYFKVSAKTYRSMIVLTKSFTFYEVNEGPFRDDMTEFANWSEPESNEMALETLQVQLMNYKFSSETIKIRQAKENDFETLYSLYVEAMKKHVERIYGWEEQKQSALFKERFQLEDQFVFELDGEIIGRLQYWWDSDHYFLDNIALGKQSRNKKIGEKIINQLMGDADVCLQVYKRSEAIKFYRRIGFQSQSNKDNHLVLRRYKINQGMWKILYFTNEERMDDDDIPNYLRSQGHEVVVWHERVTTSVLEELQVDFIVSDRSRTLIKQDVLDIMPYKIINLHPSYLPYNKGYHPIFFSILEGTQAGTSLHYIDAGIDTGDVIAQTKIHYSTKDTLQSAYDRTRRATVELFKKEWPNIRKGCFTARSQTEKGTFHWKKDFCAFEDKLPNGWDTSVEWIRNNLPKFID